MLRAKGLIAFGWFLFLVGASLSASESLRAVALTLWLVGLAGEALGLLVILRDRPVATASQ
jgi:hypothetical protein